MNNDSASNLFNDYLFNAIADGSPHADEAAESAAPIATVDVGPSENEELQPEMRAAEVRSLSADKDKEVIVAVVPDPDAESVGVAAASTPLDIAPGEPSENEEELPQLRADQVRGLSNSAVDGRGLNIENSEQLHTPKAGTESVEAMAPGAESSENEEQLPEYRAVEVRSMQLSTEDLEHKSALTSPPALLGKAFSLVGLSENDEQLPELRAEQLRSMHSCSTAHDHGEPVRAGAEVLTAVEASENDEEMPELRADQIRSLYNTESTADPDALPVSPAAEDTNRANKEAEFSDTHGTREDEDFNYMLDQSSIGEDPPAVDVDSDVAMEQSIPRRKKKGTINRGDVKSRSGNQPTVRLSQSPSARSNGKQRVQGVLSGPGLSSLSKSYDSLHSSQGIKQPKASSHTGSGNERVKLKLPPIKDGNSQQRSPADERRRGRSRARGGDDENPFEATFTRGAGRVGDSVEENDAHLHMKHRPQKQVQTLQRESLHPLYTELVEGVYKRPVVLSILIDKRKLFNLKDSLSPIRRKNPEKKLDGIADGRTTVERSKRLKTFTMHIYDLVESKEAMYICNIRDFNLLLLELVDTYEDKFRAVFRSTGSSIMRKDKENKLAGASMASTTAGTGAAVNDYFKPNSMAWWIKYLKRMILVFTRPSGALATVIDKKAIRKYVENKMKHHEWMVSSVDAGPNESTMFSSAEEDAEGSLLLLQSPQRDDQYQYEHQDDEHDEQEREEGGEYQRMGGDPTSIASEQEDVTPLRSEEGVYEADDAADPSIGEEFFPQRQLEANTSSPLESHLTGRGEGWDAVYDNTQREEEDEAIFDDMGSSTADALPAASQHQQEEEESNEYASSFAERDRDGGRGGGEEVKQELNYDNKEESIEQSDANLDSVDQPNRYWNVAPANDVSSSRFKEGRTPAECEKNCTSTDNGTRDSGDGMGYSGEGGSSLRVQGPVVGEQRYEDDRMIPPLAGSPNSVGDQQNTRDWNGGEVFAPESSALNQDNSRILRYVEGSDVEGYSSYEEGDGEGKGNGRMNNDITADDRNGSESAAESVLFANAVESEGKGGKNARRKRTKRKKSDKRLVSSSLTCPTKTSEAGRTEKYSVRLSRMLQLEKESKRPSPYSMVDIPCEDRLEAQQSKLAGAAVGSKSKGSGGGVAAGKQMQKQAQRQRHGKQEEGQRLGSKLEQDSRLSRASRSPSPSAAGLSHYALDDSEIATIHHNIDGPISEKAQEGFAAESSWIESECDNEHGAAEVVGNGDEEARRHASVEDSSVLDVDLERLQRRRRKIFPPSPRSKTASSSTATTFNEAMHSQESRASVASPTASELVLDDSDLRIRSPGEQSQYSDHDDDKEGHHHDHHYHHHHHHHKNRKHRLHTANVAGVGWDGTPGIRGYTSKRISRGGHGEHHSGEDHGFAHSTVASITSPRSRSRSPRSRSRSRSPKSPQSMSLFSSELVATDPHDAVRDVGFVADDSRDRHSREGIHGKQRGKQRAEGAQGGRGGKEVGEEESNHRQIQAASSADSVDSNAYSAAESQSLSNLDRSLYEALMKDEAEELAAVEAETRRRQHALKARMSNPQKRAVEIIKWARMVVGGPPEVQDRKISLSELKLLHSPFAQKILIDPVDVDNLMADMSIASNHSSKVVDLESVGSIVPKKQSRNSSNTVAGKKGKEGKSAVTEKTTTAGTAGAGIVGSGRPLTLPAGGGGARILTSREQQRRSRQDRLSGGAPAAAHIAPVRSGSGGEGASQSPLKGRPRAGLSAVKSKGGAVAVSKSMSALPSSSSVPAVTPNPARPSNV